jgi:hypothetical protein
MQWCAANGANDKYRIVLAGFTGEGHEVLTDHGWREVEWFEDGYLTGGQGNQSKYGHQQHKERLWLSPHCLTDAPAATEPDDDSGQIGMFDELEEMTE